MRTLTNLSATSLFIFTLTCCDRPGLPPYPCISEDPGSVACATMTGERCSAIEAPSTCPSDIAPDHSYGCDWRGLCADNLDLALWCCPVSEPVTADAAALPPFPQNPGDGACRPQGDPGEWGCLPKWWLVGEGAEPNSCTTCGEVGQQVWGCLDTSHPPDCPRIGDAPYDGAGFYCCSCTI